MNASVTLSLDSSPFAQGLDRAEKRAQTFGSKVETTFQGLFKRTPGRRAERAIGSLLGDISTGNAAQGIAQFAGRLTGLGLAAGVGIGVAVELFDKLHESVVEVRKAHDELDRQMAKPLNLTSIEGLGKAIENLQEKQGTFTHATTNYLKDYLGGSDVTGRDLGKSGIDEEKEIQDAINKRQAAERLRGRTELVRSDVLSGLENDPQRKALAEMRFKFEDRRNALMASPDKGSADRLKALDAEQDAAERNFRLHKADSNARLEVEEKIAKLQRLPVSAEQHKQLQLGEEIKGIDAQIIPPERKRQIQKEIDALKERIGFETNPREQARLDKQLYGKETELRIAEESTPERQRELRLQKFRKQTELRGVTTDPNAQRENPFAFGTIAARDFENEQGFGSLAQRNKDQNDASVFGSLGANAMNRGESPQTKNAEVNAELLAVSKEMLAVYKEAWTSK